MKHAIGTILIKWIVSSRKPAVGLKSITIAFTPLDNGPLRVNHELADKILKREIVGNMQAVTNVCNPDIIEKTCKKGCSCFNEENGCMRDYSLKEFLNMLIFSVKLFLPFGSAFVCMFGGVMMSSAVDDYTITEVQELTSIDNDGNIYTYRALMALLIP